jgi:endonuclease/exonuclease/phosphatase (EEP) superfamily protein YafD
LVAAAWLAVVWPSPGADPVGASPPFRVVSSNALFDNPRLDALVAEWREESPDVLLIQEYSPAVEASMLSLRRQYPFRVELPQPGAFGIAVFSRWPIDNTHTVQLGPVPMLQADVHVRGKTVSIWNVHTLPPRFEGADDVWAAQLDQLAEAMAAHPGPLVVAGDFNLTRHHSHYRGLTAVADDAYGRCGRWLAATWPTEELSPTGPLVKLDHLFLKGPIRCRTLREGANPGSDHRSIMATLGW